ncbi:MAG TPA: hypothetical protein VGO67_25620 [Verrucomicrobiae bacterium]
MLQDLRNSDLAFLPAFQRLNYPPTNLQSNMSFSSGAREVALSDQRPMLTAKRASELVKNAMREYAVMRAVVLKDSPQKYTVNLVCNFGQKRIDVHQIASRNGDLVAVAGKDENEDCLVLAPIEQVVFTIIRKLSKTPPREILGFAKDSEEQKQ